MNQNSYLRFGFCSSEKVGFSCKFFEFDSGKETIYVHKNVTHTQNKVLKDKGLGFWFQLVKI